MARVVVNRQALNAYFRSAQPQAALQSATDALAAKVQDESPVQTGRFQDSIRARRNRARRRVISTDPFGHLVEWGSPTSMVYAPFRRAIRALGFRFDEAEKSQTFEPRDDG